MIPARFMCRLRSLTLEESNFLNCSDYCGTEDEECNGSDIRGATCSDVGCSGSGSPTCTESCRLDYSTCTSSATEIKFQFDLETVNNAWELSWVIEGDDDPLWTSDESYRNHDRGIQEVRCMETGSCYSFELSDVGGDGICCGFNEFGSYYGHFLVSIDGELYGGNRPDFGSSAIFNFGTCASNTLPLYMPPTQFPSNSPSISPSELPTSIPSIHPTSKPTTFPSINPTAKPSIHPTLQPSVVPTIFLSTRPSTVPSTVPTAVF